MEMTTPPTTKPKNTIMIGFRADLLVRVRDVLQGSALPDFIWTQTVLTDMIRPEVPVLFFVRRAKQHPYDTVSIYVPPYRDGHFRAPQKITLEILKSADISGAVCGAQ
jgi:hypothetical protein